MTRCSRERRHSVPRFPTAKVRSPVGGLGSAGRRYRGAPSRASVHSCVMRPDRAPLWAAAEPRLEGSFRRRLGMGHMTAEQECRTVLIRRNRGTRIEILAPPYGLSLGST